MAYLKDYDIIDKIAIMSLWAFGLPCEDGTMRGAWESTLGQRKDERNGEISY